MPSSPHADSRVAPLPWWQIALPTALLFALYAPVLARLVVQWTDPYFGHGFFVPLFSAYVLWQERKRLARLAPNPSRWGLLILAISLCLLILGTMGVELFTARFSFLLAIAALIVLSLGWHFFRAVFFPWAFLLLAIPIPAILFNQITFPLQLLASRFAADVLSWLSVPVLLQGNVIELAHTRLEVAEACSGIRSLLSLLTLAIIYGYLAEKRRWARWFLALASVPIAVLANSIRIIGTGLIAQYWDPDKAEGALHAWWGVIIFVVSLIMLYALHAAINLRRPPRETSSPAKSLSSRPEHCLPEEGNAEWRDLLFRNQILRRRSLSKISSNSTFALATLLIVLSATFLYTRTRNEVFPPRQPLQSFPAQLGPWTSTDLPLDPDELKVLGPGDFLLRDYQAPVAPSVNLFIAYFPSQRTGETPHSPQHCLPGSGWAPIENKRIPLSMPGHAPFPVNRYVIAMGDARQLVLYWFWAHDRGVASEYWNKYYLIRDSIALHRSDGALVRLVTPMYPGESIDAAQQRLLPFASQVLPLLNTYIPR